MLKYLRGGLGGPPVFVACQSISVMVIRAVGSGGFCVFRLLSLASSSWLVLSMLEMQVFFAQRLTRIFRQNISCKIPSPDLLYVHIRSDY
jgi:hypothetical protein